MRSRSLDSLPASLFKDVFQSIGPCVLAIISTASGKVLLKKKSQVRHFSSQQLQTDLKVGVYHQEKLEAKQLSAVSDKQRWCHVSVGLW